MRELDALQERTKNAEFIIISLRNNMFELADRLIGIYKTHDCTHHVVLDVDMLSRKIAAASMPPPALPAPRASQQSTQKSTGSALESPSTLECCVESVGD